MQASWQLAATDINAAMVTNRRFYFCFVLLAAILLGLGFVHGLWTDRWATASAADDLVAHLERIPRTVGAWEGKPIEESHSARPLTDQTKSLMFRYVNQDNGNVVSVLVTCGRPGPMVIQHLPTECYVSAGYEIAEQPKRFVTRADADGISHEFWVATFSKTSDVIPVHARVYWSWSATGEWRTPERPRLTFARYPILYKLMVVQSLGSATDQYEGSPTHEFIRGYTAELRKSLFASTK